MTDEAVTFEESRDPISPHDACEHCGMLIIRRLFQILFLQRIEQLLLFRVARIANERQKREGEIVIYFSLVNESDGGPNGDRRKRIEDLLNDASCGAFAHVIHFEPRVCDFEHAVAVRRRVVRVQVLEIELLERHL